MNRRVAENDDAQWVSTLSFDEQAIAQADSFEKGAKVYCEGRLRLNEWQGDDGKKRSGLAAIANYSRLVAIGRHRQRGNGEHRTAAARRTRGDGDNVRKSVRAYGSDPDDAIPW
jgi:single-stranded DNA-binding protein